MFTVALIQILRIRLLVGALMVGGIRSNPNDSIRIWIQLERGDGEVWVNDVHQREVLWRNGHGGSGWGNHWRVFRGFAVSVQVFSDFTLFQS